MTLLYHAQPVAHVHSENVNHGNVIRHPSLRTCISSIAFPHFTFLLVLSRPLRATIIMFNFLPVLLALVALARAICMYDCEPIYTIRSDPFNLVLVSEDASLNGTTLSICHSGAVIWTLCPTHSEDEVDDPVVLYHNSTDTAITNVRTLIAFTLLPASLTSHRKKKNPNRNLRWS
jgi:hypothetical protein